jgi:hypothetical protein
LYSTAGRTRVLRRFSFNYCSTLSTHKGLKQAYFWYAIAAKYKYEGADQKLQEVAAKLSKKEIAEEAGHVWNYEALNGAEELKKH